MKTCQTAKKLQPDIESTKSVSEQYGLVIIDTIGFLVNKQRDEERISGMARFKSFIWRQWIQIRGNVKYGMLVVAYGGGGAVFAWLASYIQKLRGAPLQDRLGYLLLAILIFCALVLSSIFLFMVMRQDRAQESIPSPAPPVASHTPVELPKDTGPEATPLPVDFRGEILELHICHAWSTFPVDQAQIFLRTRIVNLGMNDGTITAAGLHLQLYEYRKDGIRIQIPINMRIKREREGGFIGTAFDEFPLQPELGVAANSAIYQRGIPHEGWLAFEVYMHGGEEFPNAQFDLILEDSFGGRHRITRKAGVYRTPSLIAIANQTALPRA